MTHATNILFQKPNFEELSKAGYTLTDMHFHSHYSDTYTSVDRILKWAAKIKVNLALTDHNEIAGVKKIINNKLGVIVVPGIEVSCFEGEHILVYFTTYKELEAFFKKYIKGNRIGDPWSNTMLKTVDLLEACTNYDCMAVAAHPFALGYYGIEKNIVRGFLDKSVLEKLHAIEVICGNNLRRFNRKAIELSKHLDYSFTGGSDGHNLKQLGDSVVATKASTAKGIINEIRAKQNLVIGTESSYWYMALTAWKSLIRHSRYLKYSARFKYSNLYKKSFKYYGSKLKLP